MDWKTLTLVEARRLIAAGKLSPRELVRETLGRIERIQPLLNCYLTWSAERALAEAEAAEAGSLAAAKRPLAGIPLAVKDIFETADFPTSAGTKFELSASATGDPEPGGPRRDAAAVERLRAAGAVLFGKLNMHEIALGVTNENPHFGDCRNPWDVGRITGGSSGGSAAALAAGLCLASLGTDTGGSIRIPASLCGVVGLKPTYGRVSLRGVIPLSRNLDHAGPMARCVSDAALLLRLIEGYDDDDPASLRPPRGGALSRLRGGVRGWKIALADDAYFTDPGIVDAEVLSAVRSAADVFRSLGARVEAVPFPGAREAALANGMMTQADAAAFHRGRLAAYPGRFGRDVLERLQNGAALPLSEYISARRTQVESRRRFERFFQSWDILLVPTTPIPAPQRSGKDAVERARLLTRFTAPFNLTGLPALSLPCGLTDAGLPIGLQLIARPWGDGAVLHAAHAYERAVGRFAMPAEPSPAPECIAEGAPAGRSGRPRS
jgi:aspartyl-tRNA(Asn)/glutamyl-tRNA(Gln) amidotransferase subunit A